MKKMVLMAALAVALLGAGFMGVNQAQAGDSNNITEIHKGAEVKGETLDVGKVTAKTSTVDTLKNTTTIDGAIEATKGDANVGILQLNGTSGNVENRTTVTSSVTATKGTANVGGVETTGSARDVTNATTVSDVTAQNVNVGSVDAKSGSAGNVTNDTTVNGAVKATGSTLKGGDAYIGVVRVGTAGASTVGDVNNTTTVNSHGSVNAKTNAGVGVVDVYGGSKAGAITNNTRVDGTVTAGGDANVGVVDLHGGNLGGAYHGSAASVNNHTVVTGKVTAGKAVKVGVIQ